VQSFVDRELTVHYSIADARASSRASGKPVVSSPLLDNYYQQFGTVEVTFTKQVAEALRLLPKFVFLKCQADTLPCIICSCSMREARVIATLHASALRAIRQAGNAVALRFCFERPERSDSLSFYVATKITGSTAYNKETPELYLLSLDYTNRPPDDLIGMLGELLEANVNAQRRKEVRIDITPASMKALGLESKEALLLVQGAENHCLLRDLSFSGAKVLVYGQTGRLLEKPVVLCLYIADEKKPIALPGKVLRFETVSNREDIGAVAILFEEQKVPMPYKIAINNYLRLHRYALPPERGSGKNSG
jgi:hypothetical protein